MGRAALPLAEIVAWLRAAAPGAQLSSDSRRIAPGDAFIAFPGVEADGRAYIANAALNGARAILYEDDERAADAAARIPPGLAALAVSGLKQKAGAIANLYYGQPDRAMFSVGITGTNGKTSCANWLAGALSRQGAPAAMIGTLGAGLYKDGAPEPFDQTGYTTPDAVQLQRRLAELRDAGAAALAIEASSIGLDQGRLNGLHFDAALFTNFTRDHLDYHGGMDAYEAAKARLFDWPGLRHAVLNLDDATGMKLAQSLSKRGRAPGVIGYTIAGNALDAVAVVRAEAIQASDAGTAFRVDSPYGRAQVRTQLVGNFNVSNALGVLGVLLAQGTAWEQAIAAIEAARAVPGRMQQLGGKDAPLVVIDYAHTPDALDKTLASLRQVAQQRGGRLWCLFGCGGDRDPGKRPQMGKVSEKADHIVITSDNPRGEDPVMILSDIVEGISTARLAKAPPQVMEDRATAILWAVRRAAPQDVVLLAGKGHETYQEIKGRKYPFQDAEHASLALAARVTMKGGAA
jgi:UDP-N-acetylmuramoyl-L-alanyl-D-glutamate--2,6-diaminopimelate ligase